MLLFRKKKGKEYHMSLNEKNTSILCGQRSNQKFFANAQKEVLIFCRKFDSSFWNDPKMIAQVKSFLLQKGCLKVLHIDKLDPNSEMTQLLKSGFASQITMTRVSDLAFVRQAQGVSSDQKIQNFIIFDRKSHRIEPNYPDRQSIIVTGQPEKTQKQVDLFLKIEEHEKSLKPAVDLDVKPKMIY